MQVAQVPRATAVIDKSRPTTSRAAGVRVESGHFASRDVSESTLSEIDRMTNGNDQLDTSIEIVTPENVLLEYHLSGPFRRLLAYLIDVIVRIGVFTVISICLLLVFGSLGIGDVAMAFIFVMYFVLTWFYGGLLEAYWNGQTIGKRALGIRVLSTNGRPIDAMQAILRNVLREIDAMTYFFLPLAWFDSSDGGYLPIPIFTYLVGFVSMVCTKRFQRLGDLASGTMVVVEQRRWHHGLVQIDDPEIIQLGTELPANLEISRSLGQALAHYVERRRVFPPARRADLARHIGVPLCRRYRLPADTSHDQLLCAIYYRTFISDQLEEEEQAPPLAQAAELPPLPLPDDNDDIPSLPDIRTSSISSRYGGSS